MVPSLKLAFGPSPMSTVESLWGSNVKEEGNTLASGLVASHPRPSQKQLCKRFPRGSLRTVIYFKDPVNTGV